MLKLQDVATVEFEVQSRITSFHSCNFTNVLRTLTQTACLLLLGEIVLVMQRRPPPKAKIK